MTYDLNIIRDLLIDTMLSNENAVKYFKSKLCDQEMLEVLVRIAVDQDDYGGDAPIAAGDFIYQFPENWLKQYEHIFIEVIKREYSNVRTEDIAFALAKIKSIKAKALIESEIKDLQWGSRCDRFKQALELYDK